MFDLKQKTTATERIMSLRDRGLARNKTVQQFEVKPQTSGSSKVINLTSKRVRAMTPTPRADMERAAQDPNLRRDYPRLVLE